MRRRLRFPTVWAVFVALAACAGGEDGEAARQEAARESVPSATRTESAGREAGTVRLIGREEVQAVVGSEGAPVLLDVRTPEEYAAGHISGAINIPYDSVESRLEDLKAFQERGLIVYCRTGRRAGIAERVLIENGFENVWDLDGHIEAWRDEGRPLEGQDAGT